jgi:hypothetical protein
LFRIELKGAVKNSSFFDNPLVLPGAGSGQPAWLKAALKAKNGHF